MNWDLIPEVFFDLIARVLPGSLFLIGALAVHLGPEELARVSGRALPSANAASLLLFVLLAYFVAILLKGIWEFLAARGTRKVAAGQADGREVGDDRPLSDDILTIRERIPSGASRLLKLQAEKNMCEVLLAGVPILFLGDAFGMVVGVRGGVSERASLALVLLLSWVVCWRWRRNLESLYQHDLSVLVTWARKNGPSGRC